MAGGDGGLDPGGDPRRTDDARADRRREGDEPPPRSRIQFGPEAPSLEPPEGAAAPTTPLDTTGELTQISEAGS